MPRRDTEQLLQAVLADPDDPHRVQVYADALQEAGDPRGELIHLSVRAEALPVGDPERTRLEKAAAKLEKVHRKAWLAEVPAVRQGTFRRGLLDSVVATSDDFFAGAAALFARAPVRGLKLTKLKKSHISQLAPLLARWPMRELDLSGNRVDGPMLTALLANADVSRLRSLLLYDDPIGAEGAELLGQLPLTALEELYLGSSVHPQPGDAGALPLARSPHLRKLRSLRLPYFKMTAAGVVALAASPNLANVEHLNLQSNDMGDPGVLAIANSDHLRNLRSLNLGHCHAGDRGVRALLGSPVISTLTTEPGRSWKLILWHVSASAKTKAELEAKLGPKTVVW